MIGDVVSCEDILLSKESRARKQSELLAMGECLISFTMVIPGAVKCTELSIFGFEQGVIEISMMLQRNGIKIGYQEVLKRVTGYEGYWLVDSDPLYIKSLTAHIEDTFPIGRVFDIDVIDSSLESVSRTRLQLKPRSCFICNKIAHECSRSEKHKKTEVIDFINRLMQEYKNSIV